MNEFFEIGTVNGFTEGTLVVKEKIEVFAEKLVSRFLSNSQGEMGIVIKNISNFNQIFIKLIREYAKLNQKAISDIITQHLNP